MLYPARVRTRNAVSSLRQPGELTRLWNAVGESFPLPCPSHPKPPAIAVSPPPPLVPHNLLRTFTYCIYLLACLSPTAVGGSLRTHCLLCVFAFFVSNIGFLKRSLGFVEWTGDCFIGSWGWTKLWHRSLYPESMLAHLEERPRSFSALSLTFWSFSQLLSNYYASVLAWPFFFFFPFWLGGMVSKEAGCNL